MIGESPAFLDAIKKIPQIAQSSSSVLIVGATGTGKDILAERIHFTSPRKAHPFVPVNCGAIPPDLAENELFGHQGGAFTGAIALRGGLICEAEGGTLFLDEIDSFPPVVQVKLLRCIEDKTYRPLGNTKECRANVRIIAALNTDPLELIKSGRLRQDLYYRINIFTLKLPALKDRSGDIPLLAAHFLAKSSAAFTRKITSISQSAIQKLYSHSWPGNVRELEHVIERAVIFCDSGTIHEKDILLDILDTFPEGDPVAPFKETKSNFIRIFEIEYIEKLLLASDGNITKAAFLAQKDRRAFCQLIRKYKIDITRFRQC